MSQPRTEASSRHMVLNLPLGTGTVLSLHVLPQRPVLVPTLNGTYT
jgi:hypothetical protein